MTYLFVFIGGGLGASLRYWLNQSFPLATASAIISPSLLANFLGSAMAGLALALYRHYPNNQVIFAFLIIGFCGGLTTFSSYMIEIFINVEQSKWQSIFINILLQHLLVFTFFFATFKSVSFILEKQ